MGSCAKGHIEHANEPALLTDLDLLVVQEFTVFHVFLLKKFIKRKFVPISDLPESLSDDSFPVHPLGKRTTLEGRIHVYRLLIQWNHSSPAEAT
ncbi:hypothetical protein LIER_18830 [Lithospermum erythrorhizon]|uniref:Uncharacterized protein n=1 Tax=Lithospermum erythrorhizon TaxID=34254 RepID=A0AAV3QJH7_LITER